MTNAISRQGSAFNETFSRKLAAVRAGLGRISKNASNPHFRSTYADLPQILAALTPLLEENELLLTQPIRTEAHVLADRVVLVHYQQTRIECAEEGHYVVSEIAVDPATITNPQKIGAALTYYRRFTLQSLLALEVADDDGNFAAGHVPSPPAAAPSAVPSSSAPKSSAAEALANWGKK